MHVRGPTVLMDHLQRLGFTPAPGPCSLAPPPPPTASAPPTPAAAAAQEEPATQTREMVQTVEEVARLMVTDLAAILAGSSTTASQSTTAAATASPTPLPSTGSTSPQQEGSGSHEDGSHEHGVYAHVTPKAVAALIERSVEELFAGERGSAGRRCGWDRLREGGRAGAREEKEGKEGEEGRCGG